MATPAPGSGRPIGDGGANVTVNKMDEKDDDIMTKKQIEQSLPKEIISFDEEEQEKRKTDNKSRSLSLDLVSFDEDEEENNLLIEQKLKRMKYLKQQLRKKLPQVIRERNEKIEKNSKYASLCVLDAFQGRMSNGLATNSKKSKLMFTIFCIQTSDWFLNLIILSSIIHTFMIFIEPTPGECTPWISGFLTLAHIVIFLIHFLDVALKMAYQGFWEYLDHDWQFLYCITVSLHFLDLLYFRRTTLTNPLRPVIGLLRDRSFRRFFSVVKLMIPCLSETLAPLFAFLVIISVVTNVIFSSYFQEMNHDITDASLRQIHYNWLWLVLTNDTFLRLFPETAESNVFYVIFFFTVLYIGQRFILSVILGATFETFTKFTSEQVKKEKLKEYQGLTKAFSVLDDNKTGYISDVVFTALIRNLQPSYPPEEITLYYELISGGNVKGISVLQFLNLSDVLSFKFERKGQVSLHESKLIIYQFFEKYQETAVLPSISLEKLRIEYYLTYIIDLFDNKNVLMYSNWLDIFMLSFGLLDYQIGTTFPYILLTPCIFIRFLNISEFLCRFTLKRGKIFLLLMEIQDVYTIIFLIGALGILLLDSTLFLSLLWTSSLRELQILKVMRVIFRCFRIIRVFHTNHELATFLEGIVSVAPIFFQNMGFAFIVNYIFGMLGQIFFGNYVTYFSTPAYAMITVLKLFLPFNFLDILEEVMEKVHPMAIVYFLSFFLMSIIISNLSLSIIIEWYSDSLKEKSRDKSKEIEQYDHLFHTIVSRARLRRVFATSIDADLLYKNIRMVKSHDSNSDHRLKFVEKGSSINKSDLKKCQKYSNINLVEFYDAQSKELKKLTWEADFVSDLIKAKVGTVKKFSYGEAICHHDTPALEGFILTAGLVEIRLSYKNPRRKDIVVKSLQLIGGACLSPNGVHNYTCIAASDDVECIVITKDIIMSEDIDQHIVGQLLKLYYKSNEDIRKLTVEYSKKRPLRLGSISIN